MLTYSLPLWGKLLEWKPIKSGLSFLSVITTSPFMRETTWMETFHFDTTKNLYHPISPFMRETTWMETSMCCQSLSFAFFLSLPLWGKLLEWKHSTGISSYRQWKALSLYEGNYLNGNFGNCLIDVIQHQWLSLYEGNYLNGNSIAIAYKSSFLTLPLWGKLLEWKPSITYTWILLVGLRALPLWGKLLEWKLSLKAFFQFYYIYSPFMRETTWMETTRRLCWTSGPPSLSLYEGNYLNGNSKVNVILSQWNILPLPLWGKLLEWKLSSLYYVIIYSHLSLYEGNYLNGNGINHVREVTSTITISPFMRETTWMETLHTGNWAFTASVRSLPLWGKLLEWKPR